MEPRKLISRRVTSLKALTVKDRSSTARTWSHALVCLLRRRRRRLDGQTCERRRRRPVVLLDDRIHCAVKPSHFCRAVHDAAATPCRRPLVIISTAATWVITAPSHDARHTNQQVGNSIPLASCRRPWRLIIDFPACVSAKNRRRSRSVRLDAVDRSRCPWKRRERMPLMTRPACTHQLSA